MTLTETLLRAISGCRAGEQPCGVCRGTGYRPEDEHEPTRRTCIGACGGTGRVTTWQAERAATEARYAEAYRIGYRDGRLDRVIGRLSEYSMYSKGDGGWHGACGTGYYDGWHGLPENNPFELRRCEWKSLS